MRSDGEKKPGRSASVRFYSMWRDMGSAKRDLKVMQSFSSPHILYLLIVVSTMIVGITFAQLL